MCRDAYPNKTAGVAMLRTAGGFVLSGVIGQRRIYAPASAVCVGSRVTICVLACMRKTHADNSAAVSGCNSGENSDARSQSERVLGAFLSGDNVITSYKYNLSVSI